MNLFGMMELSGGAMRAERVRAEVVAANMANAETTRIDSGGPYHRQHVVFAAAPQPKGFARSLIAASFAEPSVGAFGSGMAGTMGAGILPILPVGVDPNAAGVEIAAVVADPGPPLQRYDPGHPDAGPDGYVAYPDINPITEMVDLMGATRAYGLNSSAVQAEKSMIATALELAKS